jgi:DNA sulfur modification protein DndD
MLIKSLKLINFQCYYGENTFEFSEGLNLIIGDNGSGKSKFYDAFYWVLYDEIFDSTTRVFRKTRDIKGKLVSDKAKAICLVDGVVTTSVEVVFSNPSKKEDFILTRIYSITRLDEVEDKGKKWKEPTESTLSMYRKDDYLEARIVKDPNEIDTVIKRILPSNIQPYMWFQGEQVDSLIDFKNNNTLTDAINILSDISEFDAFVNISKRAFESADFEYRKEQRRVSGDTQKSEELDTEKQRLEERIKRLEKELQVHREGLTYAEEQQDKLHGQVDAAVRMRDLGKEEKQISEELKQVDQEFKAKVQSVNKNLFNRLWALKGTQFLVDTYADKFATYENQKREREFEQQKSVEMEQQIVKKLQARLPINVPEPIYVQRMLDEGICLVCDREAPYGSESWTKIKELLEREPAKALDNSSENTPRNNFYSEFKHLYQQGLGIQSRIPNMDTEIHETFASISKLTQKRKDAQGRLERTRNEIQDLVNASAISSPQSANILNAFTGHQENIRKYDREIRSCEYDIQKAQGRIGEIDSDLRKMTRGKISQILTEKVEILADFKNIAVSTRERVFNRLISRLEEEANKHYNSMTAENKAVHGKISLVKQANGNYMPKIHDSTGQEMYGTNDSNIILIKLSVIMAIISAKKNSRAAEMYPLISDAPMSKFTENYTIGFCRTASEVYSQSIIMSKDFYFNEALRDRLFTEVENLGNVYIIEPSVPEDKRSDRNDLETKIKRVLKPNN